MQVKALVATSGVAHLRSTNKDFERFCFGALARFEDGDWGDVCTEDQIANDEALTEGYFILGSYNTELSPEGKLWIIADGADDNGDRIVTLLFPSEY